MNNTASEQSLYNCAECPLGGSCVGPVNWTSLGPLFGWWKIPAGERDPTNESKSDEQHNVFAECMFPPACLGARNVEFKKRHPEEAMVTTLASNISCNVELGFRKFSRLCHACKNGTKRQGTDRCALCPENVGANWVLMVLGVLLIFVVLASVVYDAISAAGKQQTSASVQKIGLNYLQVRVVVMLLLMCIENYFITLLSSPLLTRFLLLYK